MPYIKQEKRKEIRKNLMPENAGELNFLFTEVIKRYWQVAGHSYQSINDIVGALEGAKLEFYRRLVVPYEESKIEQNGDVY